MSDILERAAVAVKAIIRNEADRPCDNLYDADLLKIARAVIESMREPTAAMVEAGIEANAHYQDVMEMKHSWQAMIDGALK